MAKEENNSEYKKLVKWSLNNDNILFKTPLLTTPKEGIQKAQEYIKKHVLENGTTVNFKKHVNFKGGAKTKKYKLRTKGKKKVRKTKKNLIFLVSK
jgi:hypothetical protein